MYAREGQPIFNGIRLDFADMVGVVSAVEQDVTPETQAERLRAYLSALPDKTKTLLASEFEKARQRGQDLPGGELVLSALRSSMRNDPEFTPDTYPPKRHEPAPRADQAARLLFRPLEPFLIDERLEAKVQGRIMRLSLVAIWTWVARDLKPAEAKAFEATVVAAEAAGDSEAINDHCARFIAVMVPAIAAGLSSSAGAELGRKRLEAHLGDQRVVEDAADLVRILPELGALTFIPAKLPATIRNMVDEALDNVRLLLDPIAARRPALLPFALVLAQTRLVHRHQLIRLAVSACESDDPARILGSPYRHAVELVLADAEIATRGITAALKTGKHAEVGTRVKDFHDAARTLRTELNLSGDGPWQRRMAGLRGTVANALSAEIETIPGQIRRHLRQRQRDDFHEPDGGEAVGEIERRLELLAVCRNAAAEIALNEVTLRVFTEIQGYLDPRLTQLLESIRSAPETDRALKLSQIEAGIRFSARIFGGSYAQLLQKAAEVAIQSGRAPTR
jgi:hypothetical protein